MIQGVIASGLLEIGKNIIGNLFPDPEKRAEAELKLLQLQQAGELQALETRMGAIFREAESQDKWTSRARPGFMWVFYIVILMAIPMGVIHAVSPDLAAELTVGFQNWLSSIPEKMWDLFLFGYLGYSGARSFEKSKGVAK